MRMWESSRRLFSGIPPRLDHAGGMRLDKTVRLLHEFAHLIRSRVQFPKVAPRTATSIFLLTVLVAGIFAPIGLCALMCERHLEVESRRHCTSSSDRMPGMAHGHSAMNHPSVGAMGLVMISQSCQTSCVSAERLSASKEIVPQVTTVQTAAVVLDSTPEFLAAVFTAVWGLGSGPPAPPPSDAASFSILRI
jgi:hypothetical protein